MPRLRPTPPHEALRQLQQQQARSFWKRPQARLSIACVLLFVLIGVMQIRFQGEKETFLPDGQLAQELQKNPITAKSLANPQAYYTRARIYLEHDRPAEALSDYTHVISDNPQAVLAYKGRGQVFLRVKKYAAALADFEKVLSLSKDPEIRREVLNNRGLIKMQWGQYKEAIVDYLSALKQSPPPGQAALLYSNIGLAYEALADLPKAHLAYQTAQRKASTYTLAFWFEGRLWAQQKETAKAIPLLKKATTDRPDLGEAWWLLAELLYQADAPRKDCKAAQRAYQNACQVGIKKACKKTACP